MAKLPFSGGVQAERPVQGYVTKVGVDTASIDAGPLLRNVKVMTPLKTEDLKVNDIIALYWVNDTPYVLSIIGHRRARVDDNLIDTVPPPPPTGLYVKQGAWGPQLRWTYPALSKVPDLAFFTVDARLPGGAWGYDIYPVSEGILRFHNPRTHLGIQCRVRAEDVRGNKSPWVVCDTLLQDTLAPPAVPSFNTVSEWDGVRLWWTGPRKINVPDLDKFRLWVSESESGADPRPIETVGVSYEYFYRLAPNRNRWFNIQAIDAAGNVGELYPEGWIYGHAGGGGNPPPNGSFEEGDTSPDFWDLSSSSPLTATWSTDEAYDGSYSIKVVVVPGTAAAGTEFLTQTYPQAVTPGMTYLASGYQLTDDSTESSNVFRFRLYQYKDAWETPCDTASKTSSDFSNYSSAWGYFSHKFVLDSDCEFVKLALEYYGTTYNSTMYFDSVSFALDAKNVVVTDSDGGLHTLTIEPSRDVVSLVVKGSSNLAAGSQNVVEIYNRAAGAQSLKWKVDTNGCLCGVNGPDFTVHDGAENILFVDSSESEVTIGVTSGQYIFLDSDSVEIRDSSDNPWIYMDTDEVKIRADATGYSYQRLTGGGMNLVIGSATVTPYEFMRVSINSNKPVIYMGWGADITSAMRFALVGVNTTTVNSETFDANDLMIGNNSTGKINVKLDDSAGDFMVRVRTTTGFKVNVDLDCFIPAGGLWIGATPGTLATGQLTAEARTSNLMGTGAIVSLTTNTTGHAATIDWSTNLLRWIQTIRVQTTNDIGNYWTLALRRRDTAANLATMTTVSLSPDTWTRKDASISSTALTTTMQGVYINCAKTGSPGQLDMFPPALYIE